MNPQTILLIHGPNLNRLGLRNPEHYGHLNLQKIEELTLQFAEQYQLTISPYQSNHEGDLIDFIQREANSCFGIIINPGAFTHYSYALHDALIDCGKPAVEVHLSNIAEREEWRRHSVTAAACIAQISGHKSDGYLMAVEKLLAYSKEGKA